MSALLGLLLMGLRPDQPAPPEAIAQADAAEARAPAPVEDAPLLSRAGETESPGPMPALAPPKDTGKAAPVTPIQPPAAKPKPEPVEIAAGRYKAGDTFTQEVVVTRRSAYRILGADVGQNIQYGFVSRFTIDKVEHDGGLVVRQKVQEARFSDGDPAMQALLNDALKKTQDATFEMSLNDKGEVTRFKGPKDAVNVFGNNNPLTGRTFLLWSFLDEDAWKELAQITFFQPDRALRPGATWSRRLSHSWGSLGRWDGQTAYRAEGKQAGRERIAYAHEMTYQPPRGGGDLPFLVKRADFKPLVAGGVILFDAERGKVAVAEETFRVRGAVLVSAGDVEAAVEMDETQVFRLRITEAAPAAK
jgi:hypothetical protein